jgi:L-alanine-DL-glutamate epimerase-like enolase superfamily enzyme
MAAQARDNAHRPLLKIKLGSDGDIERMDAVCKAAPNTRIIVDANEGWREYTGKTEAATKFGIALIEQPAQRTMMRYCATATQCRSVRTKVFRGAGSRETDRPL